ncbi:V-type ATP synthase subunit I [Alienimonas californiensis]|uniref:V-type ATP synthase subunit I n=1 Tax=Alienimonas californiensis TaxID=2527989 RepID=A0A517PBF0_9PLAN|nr:V-type ATPase 116kDa subunit family protein [Alienimonas californiensis]QDT16697.1 V-type ATP synthase subunit I [Alienimonas californiensis]
MAIVALDKLTVFGPASQKFETILGLQELGCLHLIPLGEAPGRTSPPVSQETREALRYLDACAVHRAPSPGEAPFDREAVTAEVLATKHAEEALADERDELQEKIAALEPWGDFERPPEGALGRNRLWFYLIPIKRLSELPGDVVWEVVRRDRQFAYVVAVAESPAAIPLRNVELDPRSLSELRARLATVERELDDAHWRRVTQTRWRDPLRLELDRADDAVAQAAAAAAAWGDENVFALRGWSPRVAVDDVRAFCDRRGLALTVEVPAPTDAPPTLLQNPDRVAGAEGCVTFYITPGYRAWDPTGVVYLSFALFFGMIVSDAAYGLVLVVGLLLFWGRLGQSRSARQFRYLAVGLVSFTVAYGVAAGSYFGLEPPAGSLLDRLRVYYDGQPMTENRNAMMAVSVMIGVAHLTLANLIAAWNSRRSSRLLGHLGWAVVIVSGFLWGAGAMTKAPALVEFGMPATIAGAVLVILFSSAQPLLTASPKAHALRLFDGAMQIPNLTKAFGDVLSYLRLFALGLASAQLAITFNDLASQSFRAGGAGVALALVILVAGHAVNILLGLMGGVVHGLRLNCIEFFNWSLNDEGYPFRPFTKKATS